MTDHSAPTRGEVTQVDKDKRAEILKYIIESLDRPCVPGDGPDERNDELERIIAAHRLATIEECAKVIDDHGQTWGLSYRTMTDELSRSVRNLGRGA